MKLRSIFSYKNFRKIKANFERFISSIPFKNWKGSEFFMIICDNIFSKFSWSQKSIKYIEPKVYKAWRAVIREFRRNIESLKKEFNTIKFLVLMNPINMNRTQKNLLRELLVKFPWLRPYREIIRKFYYQFRIPPEKRSSLKFLLKIVSDKSHSWLKSAVDTLIKNEEQIFRFQVIYKKFPKLKNNKAFKVVNESTMKKINKLFRVQHGMRTVENIQMRISNYLKCPIIVSSAVLEDLKNELK